MTDLSAFGHDPLWLILAKALGIFVFLMLTVLAGHLSRAQGARPDADAFRPQPGWPKGLLQSLVDGLKLG
jgi:NADH-quinone oxidoreductase subunit H